MATRIVCPNCGIQLSISDDQLDTVQECFFCRKKFCVPGNSKIPYAVAENPLRYQTTKKVGGIGGENQLSSPENGVGNKTSSLPLGVAVFTAILLIAAGFYFMYYNPSRIRAAAKLNIRDTSDRGRTPIFRACIVGDVKQVKKMISDGADVNVKDDYGCTPLHMSVKNPEITKLMLKNGADTDCQENKGGSTPLHWALITNIESSKAIIKSGAKVDIVAYDGMTALHLAAVMAAKENSLAYLELVQLLIKGNASPTYASKKGLTPLDYIEEIKDPHVKAEYLRAMGH